MRMISACFVCSLALVSAASAENWGHWRGPTGNGAALNASPPTEWSDAKNVKWKVELPGRENSSPIVWDQQVFVTTAAPAGGSRKLAFKLLCFDRANGDLVWERTAVVAAPHQGTHKTNGFASASPCTDGEFVYAHFGSRGLFCYTLSGDPVWQRDLGKMNTLNSFGEGSSPTLEGDMILVPWDHQGPSALYALDKRTGKTIWRTPRDNPTGWATPLVVEDAGRKQVIMNGDNYARSYDLESGKELWRCGGQTKRPAASPSPPTAWRSSAAGFRGRFSGPSAWMATGTSPAPTKSSGRSTTTVPTSPRRSSRPAGSTFTKGKRGCCRAWTPPPASRTTSPNGSTVSTAPTPPPSPPAATSTSPPSPARRSSSRTPRSWKSSPRTPFPKPSAGRRPRRMKSFLSAGIGICTVLGWRGRVCRGL